jgi:hypothetical protein
MVMLTLGANAITRMIGRVRLKAMEQLIEVAA